MKILNCPSTWLFFSIQIGVVCFCMQALHAQSLPYPVVDTHQQLCYNNNNQMAPPQSGQPFYGQDAQRNGLQPSYTLSGDSLTVLDNVTRLTWQQGADTNGDRVVGSADKMTYAQAVERPKALNDARFGGYDDWRLPTIKELYSLIDFRGTDPNPTSTDTQGLTPFIDRATFPFCYGDLTAGERIIDAQYATTTLYTSTTMGGNETMFGVNFADGRIKGYPKGRIMGGQFARYFVLCVRGNNSYGRNDFLAHGDSTVTDRATGLMWSQGDYGVKLNWQEALAWVQAMNGRNYLGHGDWRLPNVKELQSIVDYARSPDYTQSPAIDPIFSCTRITNEAGQTDYASYWSSTTHGSINGAGATGSYVAFGRGMGYMNGAWIDVHGAGCQRSDPKSGDPAQFPQGRGPQGDAIRIYNFARLVRDISAPNGIEQQENNGVPPTALPELGQNFPNPFFDATTISYTLPTASEISLRVFDALGRSVVTLFEGMQRSGSYSLPFSLRLVAPGRYTCVLTAGDIRRVRTMIVF
jgi:hypothetical protein